MKKCVIGIVTVSLLILTTGCDTENLDSLNETLDDA